MDPGVYNGLRLTCWALLGAMLSLPLSRFLPGPAALLGVLAAWASTACLVVGLWRCCQADYGSNQKLAASSLCSIVGGMLLGLAGNFIPDAALSGLLSGLDGACSFLGLFLLVLYAVAACKKAGQSDLASRLQWATGLLFVLTLSTVFVWGTSLMLPALLVALAAFLSYPLVYSRAITTLGTRFAYC